MNAHVPNDRAAKADALFRAEFQRQARGRFEVRQAEAGDAAFLLRLFAEVQSEATRRVGGDPSLLLATPLLSLQFQSQSASYAGAYPLACHYLVTGGDAERAPIGRMLIDWTGNGAVAGVDLAVLPSARRGAVGLHLLRSWVTTCDLLRRPAQLRVMPDNPARVIYRRLGFVESNTRAFPVPMMRAPRL